MKSIKIYAFLLFFCFAGLQACKKDLGNYTLTEVDVPTRDAADVQAAYNVEQSDNLTINPKINYKGDEANLSYQWLMYIVSPSSVTIGPPVVLAETKQLNRKMDMAPGNYYLELVITDNTSAVKTTSRSLLNVLALMESGWLVLHSANNESDVDYITNPNLIPGALTKRIPNILSAQTGSKLEGEGQFIGFSRRGNSGFNWVTVGTTKELRRFNGFNFSNLIGGQQLFRRTQTSFDFVSHLNNGANELIVSKTGQLFAQSWTLVQEALFGGLFNGDYNLSPYMVFNDYSSYGATVYDQKNGRFMYTTQVVTNLNFVNYRPSVAGQAFDPSNVGKELLFMDRGFGSNAYAFFKDKTGNGRYLYVLNQNRADAGNVADAAYDMTTLPDIQDAKFFQVGSLGNVALYATEHRVYRFDYSGTRLAELVFDGIPANESITSMKIYKPKINLNNIMTQFAATDNSLVYLATWNGTEGKLYELRMNVANGLITATPLNVYTGFGRIHDMTPKFRGSGI